MGAPARASSVETVPLVARAAVAARRALAEGAVPQKAAPVEELPPVAPTLAAGHAALTGSATLRADLSKALATLP